MKEYALGTSVEFGDEGRQPMKKFREAIARELAEIDGYEWGTLKYNLKSVYLHNAQVVIKGVCPDGCRLAVVKEVGELPKIGYYLYEHEKLGYEQGQQDMIEAHYVQEEV